MRKIGFSTGAVARGDFYGALEILRTAHVPAVELSALRLVELAPLVRALSTLALADFTYVSFHAPSSFKESEEKDVVRLLEEVAAHDLPIIVHPDVIFDFALWEQFGSLLIIENMDKRKPVGRTVLELCPIFDALPSAMFCFDIGHARQVDPTMTEAALLLNSYGDRLLEIHMSEVNTASRHDPISYNAVAAFASVADQIPESVPIILETLIDQGQSDIQTEMERARLVFATMNEGAWRQAIA